MEERGKEERGARVGAAEGHGSDPAQRHAANVLPAQQQSDALAGPHTRFGSGVLRFLFLQKALALGQVAIQKEGYGYNQERHHEEQPPASGLSLHGFCGHDAQPLPEFPDYPTDLSVAHQLNGQQSPYEPAQRIADLQDAGVEPAETGGRGLDYVGIDDRHHAGTKTPAHKTQENQHGERLRKRKQSDHQRRQGQEDGEHHPPAVAIGEQPGHDNEKSGGQERCRQDVTDLLIADCKVQLDRRNGIAEKRLVHIRQCPAEQADAENLQEVRVQECAPVGALGGLIQLVVLRAQPACVLCIWRRAGCPPSQISTLGSRASSPRWRAGCPPSQGRACVLFLFMSRPACFAEPKG